MLKTLKQEYSLTGPISTSILDPGDAVGAWTGANLAAVLFPTAETLSSVRSIAEARPEGLTMLVNPQWQAGQLVSDFGWGPWRARNEELVGSFQETYTFKQLRIQGEDVRVLYAFPGRWQVHVAEDDGSLPLVWTGVRHMILGCHGAQPASLCLLCLIKGGCVFVSCSTYDTGCVVAC